MEHPKTSRVISTLPCEICAQPSRHRFYGVQSCEACKQFFRRVILKQNMFQCESAIKSQCILTKGNSCRGCRLDKCLAQGMNPWLVLKAEVKSVDCQKFITRIEKRRNHSIHIFQLASEKASEKCLEPFAELLEIEAKIRCILYSTTVTPKSYANIDNLEIFLADKSRNILAICDRFSEEPYEACDQLAIIEHIVKHGFCHQPNGDKYATRELLVAISFAKTLPIFGQIHLEDQMSLMTALSLPAAHLFNCFHSMHNDTLVMPWGIMPMQLFTAMAERRYSGDKIISNLAHKIYDVPVKAFGRIKPTKEEFMLIMTMLFHNSAITGLSPKAQQLLSEHCEQYSKLLLQLQQRQFGGPAGALRYMECLHLIQVVIESAARNRELHVYISSIFEQDNLRNKFNKALAPLVFNG